MKHVRLIALVVLIASALFLMPACDSGGGGGGSANMLVGAWTVVDASNPGDIGYVVVFYANGTVVWGPITGTYAYGGGSLTINVGIVRVFALAWLTDLKIQITDTGTGDWIILVKT